MCWLCAGFTQKQTGAGSSYFSFTFHPPPNAQNMPKYRALTVDEEALGPSPLCGQCQCQSIGPIRLPSYIAFFVVVAEVVVSKD